ncbi:MAG: hypothetical protein ACXVXG_07810 [Nocardioidaceae bacterium]
MTGFEPTAWAWVEHVRAGGCTPWLDFVGSAAVAPAPATDGRGPLPGAAQLELVRRLAERGTTEPAAFTRLADTILPRSGPGRGLAQLPLLWPPDGDAPRIGAPPVDPAEVPTEELVRVGVGALTDLLQRRDPAAPARPRRHRPCARSFHQAGAPTTTAAVRAALAAAGLGLGGRSPEVLVFAPPFEQLLGQVWSARVQAGAPVRWPTFVTKWAGRRDLPPSADLAAIASGWAERVGPDRVHLVCAGSEADARRTAAAVLGVDCPDARHRPTAQPSALSAAGVDLTRRVNRLLNVRLPADRHAAVLRSLVAALTQVDPLTDGARPGLAVPRRHRPWAQAVSERVVEGLRGRGYAVHGDLDSITVTNRTHPGAATRPRRRDVLDLVLDACLWAAEPS